MAIQKPAPLMVGNKAYYTLTSYDPVEVEVIVPFITDEEVELALGSLLEDEGGTVENLSDPDWITKHFEGLRSTDELHRVLRARLREMNAQFAEDQKRDKCMVALAERLGQSVPSEHVAAVRAGIYANFKQRAAANGMTMDEFIAKGGIPTSEFEAMLDAQAVQTSEIDAALDAYAHEKKLSVEEREFGPLLGMKPDDVKDLIKQARAAGRYEDIREAALRAKAGEAVVAECSCTYHHESEAEAAERLKMLRELMANG